MDQDYALALQLQAELLETDDYPDSDKNDTRKSKTSTQGNEKEMSLVDPYWETTDPNPDVRALFLQFNERFFWGRLAGIEVRWSPRMTLCAGLCCYEGRGGLCSVRLSVPLLKLRPRKDLVETLLDHDGHGPEFHKHMYRINAEAGTKISVYHNFHDEVDAYRTHWWRCNGPCQSRKPYFGYVKRAMNRAPSPRDTWWAEHQRSCGGTYTKIKEPENYGKKAQKKEEKDKAKLKDKSSVKSMDIRVFGGEGKVIGKPKNNLPSNSAGKPKSNFPTGSSTDKPKSNFPIETSAGKPVSKPKPTATVTSGVLQRTSSDIIELNSDEDNDDRFLPGSKTPSKASSKGKTSNKPVSQGGRLSFSDIKNNSQSIIEFSDSEDDDYSKLVEISDREKEKVFNKHKHHDGVDDSEKYMESDGDYVYNDDDDDGGGGGGSDFVDKKDDVHNDDIHNVSDKASPVKESVNDKVTMETGASDVRAMLRKVWGEKQFSQVSSGNVSGATNGPLSDIGSRSSGVKRPSTDNDDNFVRKKQKTTRTDNFMIHAAGGREATPVIKGDNSKPPARITSPIENLFKKMRGKEGDTSIAGSSGGTGANSSGVIDNKGGNPDNHEQSTETNYAPCPVCLKDVPASTINDHLDLCLTLQAIS